MIFFSAFLFLLLVIIINASIIVYLSPIILGLIIIIVGNMVRIKKHNKFAPIWWDILSVVATILSTSMLWKDITYEAYDYGGTPFLILIFYATFSFCLLALVEPRKEKAIPKQNFKVTPKKTSTTKYNQMKNRKR